VLQNSTVATHITSCYNFRQSVNFLNRLVFLRGAAGNNGGMLCCFAGRVWRGISQQTSSTEDSVMEDMTEDDGILRGYYGTRITRTGIYNKYSKLRKYWHPFANCCPKITYG
jgi:hypothetical protein